MRIAHRGRHNIAGPESAKLSRETTEITLVTDRGAARLFHTSGQDIEFTLGSELF